MQHTEALPEQYANIKTILKEKVPTPSLEDAINSLQEEEKKTTLSTNGAYATYSKQRNKVFEPCKYCKKTNHPSSRCFFKIKHEDQGGGNNNNNNNNNTKNMKNKAHIQQSPL
ncbi:hypothetical protein KP509_05G081800 [Ceratopteris richardii]|uniref:Uncharacterized protein n=1 Tax=Ceratopteris richardii TaxID=49495 RepID=A0A8T2UW04_CERRI|nr:hypothetical protein KP509_05G081800 [Ceratopteris richardii]